MTFTGSEREKERERKEREEREKEVAPALHSRKSDSEI